MNHDFHPETKNCRICTATLSRVTQYGRCNGPFDREETLRQERLYRFYSSS